MLMNVLHFVISIWVPLVCALVIVAVLPLVAGYIVRMEEMRQSRLICLQAIENIPAGPIMGKVGKVLKPPPGEVYHSIEAPKGELGYYIVSDGTTQPYRVRIRPPSLINLEAFDKMIRGHLVADVVAIIGTLDIVLGEVDR